LKELAFQSPENIETFKDLFDSAHDLIHLAYPDGTLMYVNHAWEKLLELSEDEVKGKSIYSFVVKEDLQRFRNYRESVLNGSQNEQEISIAFLTKSGRTVYVQGFISARFQDGTALHTRGIFRDITVRLQNEAALKRMNAELQEREFNLVQLLLHAPDAVIVIDAESVINYWNPKAEQTFGWKSEEVLGGKLTTTIIPPQYREAHENGMRRFLSTGEARMLNRTVDVSALHRTGREFYISLTISTVQQKGKTAFIAFIRDIDRQKRNELELEKKRNELEQSNRELQQFAHAASHDMKEPLRKVLLFVDMLRKEPKSLPDSSKTYLNKIGTSASRLADIVDGILAYSSISASEPDFEQVDLNEVLKTVLSDLEVLIQEKKAEIIYHDLPLVWGASFLLCQLFFNLIINSLKFSKPAIPSVVEIYGRNNGDRFVQVIIRDNGIGFDKEDAEKIFNKFLRLHPKHEYDGTGLGLALCKTIVEKHGGSIEATGEAGRGATFTVSLPAIPGA
jgi:PAS domain S-box-containing protein